MRANRPVFWLCLSCSVVALLVALSLHSHVRSYAIVMVAAWLIALASFLVAAGLWDVQRTDLRPLHLHWTLRDTICALICLGVAAALRFPALGHLPLTLLG